MKIETLKNNPEDTLKFLNYHIELVATQAGIIKQLTGQKTDKIYIHHWDLYELVINATEPLDLDKYVSTSLIPVVTKNVY